MKEEWKPIPGWEGYYEASSLGRIRSVARKIMRADGIEQGFPARVLKPQLNKGGYQYVRLCVNGTKCKKNVHRLIALTFLGSPVSHDLVVCHSNGIKTDNSASNLRWDTVSANNYDMVRHGSHFFKSKKECPRGHPFVEENIAPWEKRKGGRTCWACARSRALAVKRSEPDLYKYADSYFNLLTGNTAA